MHNVLHVNKPLSIVVYLVYDTYTAPTFKKDYFYPMEKRKKRRPRLFEEPQELWEFFQQYKKYIEDNPIQEVIWVGRDAIEKKKKHLMPPTWKGFEAFLFRIGVGNCTACVNLDNYRRNVGESYAEFLGIVRIIGAEMFERKFSGAAVGIYQYNIIARELGLADAQEVISFQRPILEGGKELPGDEEPFQDELLK